MSVVYLAVAISVVLVAILLAPFWMGQGGQLAASSSINSPQTLIKLKEAVLKRYLEDEAAFEKGVLGKNVWEKRQQFLINRYIDASRRLDFLTYDEGDGQPEDRDQAATKGEDQAADDQSAGGAK